MTDFATEARAAWAEAITPRPYLAVDQWAESEDGIVLSPRTSAFPGPLRFDLTPYLRAPLRAFSNDAVRKITLCFGTQCAKTTLLFTILGYIIDYAPGPCMMVYPTLDTARGVSKDRLQPLLQDCPALRRHLTGRDDDLQLLAYTLDRMTVRFAWSNSESATRSHPIRYLLKDELSAFAPGSSAAADERVKTFWNHKIINTSTPKTQDDPLWRETGLAPLRDSDKGEALFDTSAWTPKKSTTVWFYNVPCPRCGEMIRLEFSGLRWPTDIAIRDIDDRGWYECPACHGEIRDGDKPGMLRRGEWRTDNPGGKWEAYHLSSLYAPWEPCRFGAIAGKWIIAKMHQDPDEIAAFVNNYLALPYSIEQAGVDLVTETTLDAAAGAYQRNELPPWVRGMVAGFDVQEDRVYFVAVGFGAFGKAAIISWGQLPAVYGVKPYIEATTWTHPQAGQRIAIVAAGIDSRFKTDEVLAACRSIRRRLQPIKGEAEIKDPQRNNPLPHRPFAPERDRHGKIPAGALQGLAINTMYFKQVIYARLNAKPDEPRLIFLPADADETLRNHLASEHEVKERKRGTAEVKRKWVARPGHDDNHLLDCLVYAFGVAHSRKVHTWTEDQAVVGVVGEPQPAATATPDQPAAKPKAPARKTYLPVARGFLGRR